MTIDKEKLISLLVDKTGLEEEQVEDQLSELISRIQQAAESGKSFEIEGFGTFRMDNDTLHFEPSDRLETEINNRYAGMKPIELIGAFKEPDADEIPDAPETAENDDDIWGLQKEKEIAEPEPPATEKTPDPAATEEAPVPPADSKGIPGMPAEEKTPAEEVVTAKKTTETGKKKTKKPAAKKKEEDPIGRFLVAAVVVLAVGVGGWFVYDLGFRNETDTVADTRTSSPTLTLQQEPSSGSTEREEDEQESVSSEEEDSESREELNSGNEVPNNPENQGTEEDDDGNSPYGLYGTADDNITDGYTIVVHSLRSRQQADAMQSKLNREGYRIVVSEATINGEIYYRVGVGQFESVARAQQAVAELPDNYKDNHFIRRI